MTKVDGIDAVQALVLLGCEIACDGKDIGFSMATYDNQVFESAKLLVEEINESKNKYIDQYFGR